MTVAYEIFENYIIFCYFIFPVVFLCVRYTVIPEGLVGSVFWASWATSALVGSISGG